MNAIHIFQKPSYNILNKHYSINRNPLVIKFFFFAKKLFFTHFFKLRPMAGPLE